MARCDDAPLGRISPWGGSWPLLPLPATPGCWRVLGSQPLPSLWKRLHACLSPFNPSSSGPAAAKAGAQPKEKNCQSRTGAVVGGSPRPSNTDRPGFVALRVKKSYSLEVEAEREEGSVEGAQGQALWVEMSVAGMSCRSTERSSVLSLLGF